MIYDLALAVEADLKRRKYPFAVYFGPDQLSVGSFESKIMIERDHQAGDVWAPVIGPHRNPPAKAVRFLGAEATIWAKSNVDGARTSDHQRLCEQLVDAFYCSVQAWMHANCGLPKFDVSESRYLTPAEAALVQTKPGAPAWPGVVYVFRWRVPRGVYALTFTGDGLPTGTPTATSNEVRIRHNADDPPEIVET